MNDGGPAFPLGGGYAEPGGMSLRDYFAAHCPSDLAKINVPSDAERIAGPEPDDALEAIAWNNKIEAFLRYAYADEMLAQRKASNP